MVFIFPALQDSFLETHLVRLQNFLPAPHLPPEVAPEIRRELAAKPEVCGFDRFGGSCGGDGWGWGMGAVLDSHPRTSGEAEEHVAQSLIQITIWALSVRVFRRVYTYIDPTSMKYASPIQGWRRSVGT